LKKILGLAIAALMVMALIGGGTWAYFSDPETSTGNTFASGTLDLNLDGGDSNVVKFTVSNAKPGDSDNATWTVTNVGSLPGYLDLEDISIGESAGTSTDAELADEGGPDTPQLGNYLKVHLFVDADDNGVWDTGETDIYGNNTTYQPINGLASNYDTNILLNNSDTNYITMIWSIDGPTTDNKIQGDSVSCNMTFKLWQRSED
jgi:spore coat-associated protein N